MLIQPNKSMLGDTHLDAVENLAKLKEGNAKLVEGQKLRGQAELEDPNRASGPRMFYRELISRIQRIGPGVRVREGSEGAIALYILKTRQEREIEDERGKSPHGSFFDDHKYVGGFLKDYLPEYGCIKTDDRGRPDREDPRGWRSILIGLIKSGAITYKGAIEEFGQARGPRSNRWFEQLQDYRTL